MQFAPPPTFSVIPLKVIIEPGSPQQVIKRLTINDCTYEKLRLVLGEWVAGGRIQYCDVEGDLIEIGSDEEWAECVRHVREHLKKENIAIRVSSGRSVRLDKFIDATPTAPPLPEEEVSVAVPERESQSSEQITEQQAVVCSAEPDQPPPPPAVATQAEPHDEVNQSAMQPTVIAILKYKYGKDCLDSIQQRSNINSQEDWVTIQEHDSELTLDVDIPKLRQFINTSAMQAITQNEVERAFRWLTLGLVIFPTYDVFFYNMACASSLSGDVPSALTSITLAIKNGYRNIEHLKLDPDLSAVRSHVEFQSILSELETLQDQPQEIDNFPYLTELSKLTEMGINDNPDVRELLTMHHGDIPKVLEICLS
eukprot:TRINITY_DN2114_c0_g1_i7.p1 TRINITY_DN2114_c0_g1~~TRINITY_DN2114_c0_g1_i7.p1  ORF type:complete len:367 (+),score=63.73 TRINITY_DN2114_c0_g1_i7:69-1169(+)